MPPRNDDAPRSDDAPRNAAPGGNSSRNGLPRSGRAAADRPILLGGFPLPLRRAWGLGLLGLTLWLASVLALFH